MREIRCNSLKLYTGGFDLNPKTVNMINQGNAFKFDLSPFTARQNLAKGCLQSFKRFI